MSARLFVWRWSLRVLRREWRQHLVIFLLLTTGVMISVGGALSAYNLVEPPESQFGLGNFAATSDDPAGLESTLVNQGVTFGRVDTAIRSRSGTTERVTVKVLDPQNLVTAPLIELLEGSWPGSPSEIALTDRALADGVTIGTSVAFDEQPFVVVGLVENPTALSDEFALAAQIDASWLSTESTTEFYVDADQDLVDFSGLPNLGISSLGGPPARTAATLIVNVIGAFGMLEIGLLVASAFAVISKRRSREFGLLAAAGAPPRIIRSAAAATGAIIGLLGTAIGVVLGIALVTVSIPALESTVGHRIDLAIPVWAVAPSALLAVVVASWAARRPAKELSRLSVVAVLSSRRPRPEPVGRAAVAGVVIAAVGGTLLMVGFARLNIALAAIGTVLTPVGLLMLAPILVKLLGALSARLPLAERLAGRSIARYNRRSAAVVAALALALAIPAGIAVVTSSLDGRAVEVGTNLPQNHFIVWADGAGGFAPRIPASIDEIGLLEARDALAGVAPEVRFTPILSASVRGLSAEVVDDGGVPEVPAMVGLKRLEAECSFCSLDTYGFGDRDEAGNEINYEARITWLATPELRDALGLADSWVASAAAISSDSELTVASATGFLAEDEPVTVVEDWPAGTSIPQILASPALASEDHFEVVTIGWLGAVADDMDAETQTNIRDAASGAVVLEFHEPLEPKSSLRALGLGIGTLIGIGITISAVALLAIELAGDRALLASLGARPVTSQRMSAAIAALLAFEGAVLAALIGYVPLLPMITSTGDNFPFVVPWQFFIALVIGFPVLAGAVGWVMSTRGARSTSLRQSF